MRMSHILIVEDSPSLARTYEAQLRREVENVTIAPDGASAEAFMLNTEPSCVLLDLKLPDTHGLDLLKGWRARGLDMPVIVVTSDGSMSIAVEAMKEGAADFLVKPFGPDRLRTTVQNVLEQGRLRAVVSTYEKNSTKTAFGEFIGASLPMQAVYRTLEVAAPSNASIFITGETGTGKELAAKAVHQHSSRSSKSLVTINCGAIPIELIESELFGHVKGAFTGATSDRAGAAELANGGTLFLDEIGEMPIDLQPKLLRFLQSGTYNRVGDSRTLQSDIRIIAATNRDPWGAVCDGTLREDLFFRLNVIPVQLPSLRERGADIILLAEAFLQKFSQEEGCDAPGFARAAEQSLLNHPWPGNVRELENTVRRVVILNACEEVTDTMLALVSSRPTEQAAATPVHADNGTQLSTYRTEIALEPLWKTERRAIEHAIALCRNNVTEAAEHLEIAPSTIYRKREQWARLLEAE
jgi:two-component system repressor protein LuxO